MTGATGLIGRELVLTASRSHDVVAVTRGAPTEDAGVTWVHADLGSPELDLPRALPESVDAVVHLAHSGSYRTFPEGATDVVAINVTATARLLDYARRAGARRFVLGSTGTVYARSPEPLSEDAPLDCRSILAASKRSAELLAQPYAGILGCRILRIFTTYGPPPTSTPRSSTRHS